MVTRRKVIFSWPVFFRGFLDTGLDWSRFVLEVFGLTFLGAVLSVMVLGFVQSGGLVQAIAARIVYDVQRGATFEQSLAMQALVAVIGLTLVITVMYTLRYWLSDDRDMADVQDRLAELTDAVDKMRVEMERKL